jgi:hypothetical protein
VTRRTTILQQQESVGEDDSNGPDHAGGKQNAAAIPPALRCLPVSALGRVEPAAPLGQSSREILSHHVWCVSQFHSKAYAVSRSAQQDRRLRLWNRGIVILVARDTRGNVLSIYASRPGDLIVVK